MSSGLGSEYDQTHEAQSKILKRMEALILENERLAREVDGLKTVVAAERCNHVPHELIAWAEECSTALSGMLLVEALGRWPGACHMAPVATCRRCELTFDLIQSIGKACDTARLLAKEERP